MSHVTQLVCGGCGFVANAEDPQPFRCGGDATADTDHVLSRVFDFDSFDPGPDPDLPDSWREVFLDDEPNPFVRYRCLFHSYHTARRHGWTDARFVQLIRELDAAVAEVDGRGFRETPFTPQVRLGDRLGLEVDGLWLKNETINVGGSHKARHLFGILLWLRVAQELGLSDATMDARELAIASCGNAALAASIVARSARRSLSVYIPPDADPHVIDVLQGHGANLLTCPRQENEQGDPCYLRFREAVGAGAMPFTVQGNENGLAVEGGLTLGYEMVSQLMQANRTLDRIFVQVGGGALAASCIQAFREARQLRLIDYMPRIHAVQTQSAHPLERAWRKLMDRVIQKHVEQAGGSASVPRTDAQRATWVLAFAAPELVARELRHAVKHRSRFMWPWETPPHSMATGILDDETYDWLAVVRGMITTGGYPVVVDERTLTTAHELAREATGIRADPTGTSGLAGLVEVGGAPDERIAVLLTGVERGEDMHDDAG